MGLLDDIARTVGSALGTSGLSKPATLIRGAARHAVQAVPGDLASMRIAGTLIAGVDRVIRIVGTSLPAGVTPRPGDQIAMDGVTSTIIGDAGGNRAVSTDAARAMYLCQCVD